MCVAIPAKVIEVEQGDAATVELGGARKKVSLMLVEGVEAGEYVLVHAGFAIEKVDEEEARKTQELLEELAGLDEIR